MAARRPLRDTLKSRMRCALLMAGALAVLIVDGAAAQEVGRIADQEGTVEVKRHGAWAAAAIGSAIEVGDEVRTGRPGRVLLLFVDETVLVVGESSHVVIDRLTHKPAESVAHALFRLLQGKLRSLVPEAYRWPGATFEIETETAVAGVRGTEFVIAYDPVAEVSEVAGVSGVVEVHGTVDRAIRGVFVSAREVTTVAKGEFPTPPQYILDVRFRQYLDGLDFVGGGGPQSMSVGDALLAGTSVPEPEQAVTEAIVSPREPGQPPYSPRTPVDETENPIGGNTGNLGVRF